MKKEFKQTRIIVRDILEKNPATRNSDSLLYLEVIERIGTGNSSRPIDEILLGLEELGLPCFETVRRTRQKLQEQNPKLAAVDRVKDYRSEREEKFRKEFGHA